MCPTVPDVRSQSSCRNQQPTQCARPAFPSAIADRVHDAAPIHAQVMQCAVAQRTEFGFSPPAGHGNGQAPQDSAYNPPDIAPAQGSRPAHKLPDIRAAFLSYVAIHARNTRQVRRLDTDAEKRVLLGYSCIRGPTVTIGIGFVCTASGHGAGPTLARQEAALILYEYLATHVKNAIRQGVYQPGDRLPSVRRLSEQHRVSQNTAVSAYRLLESHGWLEARPQSGFFARRPESSLPTAKGSDKDSLIY